MRFDLIEENSRFLTKQHLIVEKFITLLGTENCAN